MIDAERGLAPVMWLVLLLVIILGLGGAMVVFLLSSEESADGVFETARPETGRESPEKAAEVIGTDSHGHRETMAAGLPEGWTSLSGTLTLDADLLSNVIVEAVSDRADPLPDSFKRMLEFSPLMTDDGEVRKLLDELEGNDKENVVDATSDSEGRFVLNVPESESLTFLLDHDFYYLPKDQAGPFFWDKGGDAVELADFDGRLEARLGALIQGEVLDDEGLPVSQAVVRLEQEANPQGMDRMFLSMMGAGRMPVEGMTDEQGFFSLRGAEPGERFFVSAECEGFVAADSEPFDAAPGETVRVRVRLGQGSSIEARVIDPEDTPLANAKVYLRKERDGSESRDGSMGGFMRAMAGPEIVDRKETDAEGRALFTALGPGEYSVAASYPGMCELPDETETVVVRQKVRAHEVTVPLGWGETISGKVTDDAGGAVADACIKTRRHFDRDGRGMGFLMRGASSWATNGPRETFSDETGFFRITGLEPDASYDLIAEKAEFTPSFDEDIKVGTKNVSITLDRPGQIEGKVYAALSQEPVEAFTIRIIPEETDGNGRGGWNFRGRNSGRDWGRGGRDRGDRGRDRRGRGFDWGRGMGRDMGRMFRGGMRQDGATSATARLMDTLRETMRSRFAGPESATEREEEIRNEDGSFILREIIPGSYRLCVSARGFSPLLSDPMKVEKGVTLEEVDFHMSPGASVSGRVQGPLGVVSKATVQIDAEGEQVLPEATMNLFLDTVEDALSARDGSFEIDGLPGGHYTLRVEHPDFPETRTEAFSLRDGERIEGMVIDLPSGGSVIGTAVDAGGAPLAATQVICSAERGRNRTRFAVTDSYGAFEIVGLREGTYRIRLLSRRSDFFSREEGPSSVSVSLAEGETREVFLRQAAAAGVTVRGTVTASGAPVESGFVTAMPLAGGAPAFAALDKDGTYSLEQVVAGENRFTVRFGNANDMDRVTITYSIPDQEEVALDIDLPDGRVRGRVTDGNTGRALAGVSMSLSPETEAEMSMWRRFSDRKRTVTDEEGSYSFRRLGPGDYRLRADYAETGDVEGLEMKYYPVEIEAVKVAENQCVEHLDIALFTGGGIEVEVFGKDGQPFERATVVASRVADDLVRQATGASSVTTFRERSDEEGVALIEPVEPGEYTLTVQARNMGQAVKEGIRVSADAIERVRFTLAEGFATSVRLTDASGFPISDAEITLRDSQNRILSLPSSRPGRFGSFGGRPQDQNESNLYALGSLSPGTYKIEATWQKRSGTAQFAVTPGSDQQKDLLINELK